MVAYRNIIFSLAAIFSVANTAMAAPMRGSDLVSFAEVRDIDYAPAVLDARANRMNAFNNLLTRDIGEDISALEARAEFVNTLEARGKGIAKTCSECSAGMSGNVCSWCGGRVAVGGKKTRRSAALETRSKGSAKTCSECSAGMSGNVCSWCGGRVAVGGKKGRRSITLNARSKGSAKTCSECSAGMSGNVCSWCGGRVAVGGKKGRRSISPSSISLSS